MITIYFPESSGQEKKIKISSFKKNYLIFYLSIKPANSDLLISCRKGDMYQSSWEPNLFIQIILE